MWGINPAVIGKILGSVFLTNIVSGTHGAPKIIRDKIVLHVANRDIATAKAMATSVAQQDMNLYDELRRELRERLSQEEWLQIFSD